jgi:hypothetical protein
VIDVLMGKDASARFRLIMNRADETQELDVAESSSAANVTMVLR